MAIINKVTKLFPGAGVPITEESIQAHIDEQNELGYNLVALDNLNGWYRFFWAKQVE